MISSPLGKPEVPMTLERALLPSREALSSPLPKSNLGPGMRGS